MGLGFTDRIREIYKYRYMISGLVRRDLRGRYKSSVLGVLWNFLTPLFQILVYIIVFSALLYRDIDSYYAYLIVGIIPWFFFSGSLHEGSNCVVANANMVKKIYFPREVLAISVVTSRFVTLIISYIIVLFILLITGFGFVWWAFLMLPCMLVLLYMFTLGLVFLFSALNVYYRDVSYIVGVLLMGWIWITPIMYMRDIDSSLLQTILGLNPMTYFIEMFHDSFYYKTIPDLGEFGICILLAVIVFAIGWYVFSRLDRRFAEEL